MDLSFVVIHAQIVGKTKRIKVHQYICAGILVPVIVSPWGTKLSPEQQILSTLKPCTKICELRGVGSKRVEQKFRLYKTRFVKKNHSFSKQWAVKTRATLEWDNDSFCSFCWNAIIIKTLQ